MADSVVSFLLEKLSQMLANEAKLLCGVEDRVRSLHNELEIINVFLKISEGEKNKEEIEQKVVDQIRDEAHVAEDVIDTFVANVAIRRRRSKLGKMLHGVKHRKLIHDVSEKIDKIKSNLNEIRENKMKYDFNERNQSRSPRDDDRERAESSLHRRRRNVEEEDVVGFVRDSKVIIKQLLEGGSQRNVVSIIGMGGLGKTTLARMVYNSNEVKRHFSCRAWVYVSNECRAKELLLVLLKDLMPNLEYECGKRKKGRKHKEADKPRDVTSLSEDEMKKMVQECLKKKRYLLVLDDLWKVQDWDEVQDAFPDDNRGSKILITSRLKEVALHTGGDLPYYLQFLNEEESWELFCKKVFRGGDKDYLSDLEPLGKQIVQSCRGLPLSIVVLAGLLANKEKSHREWSKVVGHVNWYLTQDETQVKDIVLKLSYDDLPRRLKPCFLYLGIYPEDFEIPVRPLLERWVAEGFIQDTGSRDPDDVAEDYLYELIDRSLIQVARVKTSGGAKTCRIHDLLRDLCISESKVDKVFQVCTDNNILIPKRPRRLSILCSMSRYISSGNNDHSCVRSLFCFGPFYYFTSREWKWLFKGFKLVRVLELGKNCCGDIPSNLGNFIHLRYLRIDSEYIYTIPTSICTLTNLQTLDLGNWLMVTPISFPDGICKLKLLRHLYAKGPIMLCGNRYDEVMWNLQTISCILLNSQSASLIQKGMFPKLRKLGLEISADHKPNGQLPKLLLSLQQLSHLSKLEIHLGSKNFTGIVPPEAATMEWNIGVKPQELLRSLNKLTQLSELKIMNAMDLPTCAATFPQNITKITLEGISCLNDGGMKALGDLTKLRILKISGRGFWYSDSIDLVNCIEGGFPQLHVFHMSRLKVQKWKLDNGAMSCLESLVIDECNSLGDIPNEVWSLNTLRKVLVRTSSKAMAHKLQNLEIKNGLDCQFIFVNQEWE